MNYVKNIKTIALFLFFPYIQGAEAPSSGLTSNQIQELAKKFAPEFRFHKDEQFYPSSIEWYTARASLKKRNDKTSELILKKPISASQLAKYPTKDFPKGFDQVNDYYLDPEYESDSKNLATRNGMPLHNNTSLSPLYYHVKERSNGGLIIQYICFYPHQGKTIGPESIGPVYLDVGMHEGDWEHVDVYLNKIGQEYVLDQVYFAAHGSRGHGEILRPTEITLINGTHPVVYTAKFGHASHSYNVGFDISTLDNTSDNGAKWQGWNVSLINLGDRLAPTPGQEWIQFGGRWGSTKEIEKTITARKTNSPSGPAIDNQWWRERPNQQNLIATIKVKAGKGKQSDYFDFGAIVPTRIRKLRWQVEHPQKEYITFHVNEYRYGRTDRKDIYGTLQNNMTTEISPYKKNVYIADVENSGKGTYSQPITIKIWGVEE